MARLTNRDKQLLVYPPTESTWLCGGKTQTDDGIVLCGVANQGDNSSCWLCLTPKPKKPKLLWPEYLKACQHAGIEPGTRWPVKPTGEPRTQPASKRRKKVS